MWRASSAGSSLSQPSEQMTTMEPRTVVPTRPVRSTLGSARCRCGDWPDVEGPRGNDPGEGVLAVPTRRRRRPPRSPRQEEGNRKVDGPTDVAAWAVCGRCRKRCVSAPSATCGPRGEPANLPKPRRSVVRGPGRAGVALCAAHSVSAELVDGTWAIFSLRHELPRQLSNELIRFVSTPRAIQAMLTGSGSNIARFRPRVHVTLWS
jgi:hypothetical protein